MGLSVGERRGGRLTPTKRDSIKKGLNPPYSDGLGRRTYSADETFVYAEADSKEK